MGDRTGIAGRHYQRDDAGRVIEYSQTLVDFDTGTWVGSVTASVGYNAQGRISAEIELVEALDEFGDPTVVSSRDVADRRTGFPVRLRHTFSVDDVRRSVSPQIRFDRSQPHGPMTGQEIWRARVPFGLEKVLTGA